MVTRLSLWLVKAPEARLNLLRGCVSMGRVLRDLGGLNSVVYMGSLCKLEATGD